MILIQLSREAFCRERLWDSDSYFLLLPLGQSYIAGTSCTHLLLQVSPLMKTSRVPNGNSLIQDLRTLKALLVSAQWEVRRLSLSRGIGWSVMLQGYRVQPDHFRTLHGCNTYKAVRKYDVIVRPGRPRVSVHYCYCGLICLMGCEELENRQGRNTWPCVERANRGCWRLRVCEDNRSEASPWIWRQPQNGFLSYQCSLICMSLPCTNFILHARALH